MPSNADFFAGARLTSEAFPFLGNVPSLSKYRKVYPVARASDRRGSSVLLATIAGSRSVLRSPFSRTAANMERSVACARTSSKKCGAHPQLRVSVLSSVIPYIQGIPIHLEILQPPIVLFRGCGMMRLPILLFLLACVPGLWAQTASIAELPTCAVCRAYLRRYSCC